MRLRLVCICGAHHTISQHSCRGATDERVVMKGIFIDAQAFGIVLFSKLNTVYIRPNIEQCKPVLTHTSDSAKRNNQPHRTTYRMYKKKEEKLHSTHTRAVLQSARCVWLFFFFPSFPAGRKSPEAEGPRVESKASACDIQ